MDQSMQIEVDLHILVVPDSQWRPDLRLAYTSTCMAAVSAGFVRVDPDCSLDALREEISGQLDSSSLPHSYIFLRSVGRHLCTVSRNQELSLTSKHFVPPLAMCPEIYLLDATLSEEAHSTPPHLPGQQYYSPHANTSQLPSIYPTPISSTPTTLTPASLSHSRPENRHWAVQPVNKSLTSQMAIPSSLQSSDNVSRKCGAILGYGDHTKLTSPKHGYVQEQHQANDISGYQPQHYHHHQADATPDYQPQHHHHHQADATPGYQPQHHHHHQADATPGYQPQQQKYKANTTPGYQPQDDSELHRGRPHLHNRSVSEDPLAEQTQTRQPSFYNKSENSPTGTAQLLRNRRVQKVHFESLTNIRRVISSSSSSQAAGSEEAMSPALGSSQPPEINVLLAQLRKVKEESKHLNTLKESLSSTVRQLQHKLKARKEKDDSEWKQKLSKEKKQTRTLERSIKKLKTELSAVDRVGNLKKHSIKSATGDLHKDSVEKSESNHTNMKLECKRADVDMDQLRKSLDEEKRKLKLEKERHQSIIDECKVLKKELIQKKIARNRGKKRM